MLKLVQVDNGVFELAFDDPADDDADAAVATLVYAVLYTDAVAPERRVADVYERRGWWADPPAGTGLWYVRRQALTGAARREALDMVKVALQARAPGLSGVEVQEVTQSAGNVSSVFLEVTGSHNGRKFIVRAPL
jgi:phage gp46-like protein